MHYDIAYVIQDGMIEAEQSASEQDNNSAHLNNSSSNTISNHKDGRPHEGSAQQNNNYLIPGD